MLTYIIIFLIGALAVFLFGLFSYLYSRKLISIQQRLALTENMLVKEKDKEMELENTIKKNIGIDEVTRLPNRTIFEDRLKQAINQSERSEMMFAVLFISLDGFKIVQETLGLNAGDEILKEVAYRMQSSIRKVDTLSRLNGNEFVVILTQLIKSENTIFLVQRLLTVLAQPFRVYDQDIFITANIGIAVYPNDGKEGDELLKNADNALNQAKLNGQNTYQFYQKEMYNLSRRELVLTAALRSSTIYNDFIIYYQPSVNIETKQILTMEAMLHWQHQDFGLLKYDDFSKLFENSGNVLAMGDWLLRTACQQFLTWKKIGLNPQTLMIKVCLKQLENVHFTYNVSQILKEVGFNPAELILEISELVLAGKLNLIEKSLYILKKLGIQVGISEFGTGKIALQDLRNFSIDFLKMPGSLIQDIHENEETRAIVQMIVGLANTLGLRVLAEGVDTVGQKNALYELGCFIMQGKLFSQPFLADQFTSRVENDVIQQA